MSAMAHRAVGILKSYFKNTIRRAIDGNRSRLDGGGCYHVRIEEDEDEEERRRRGGRRRRRSLKGRGMYRQDV